MPGLIWSLRCPLCGRAGSLSGMAQRFEEASTDSRLVLVQQSGGRGKLSKAQRLTRDQLSQANVPRTTLRLLNVVLQALDECLARLGGAAMGRGTAAALDEVLKATAASAQAERTPLGRANVHPMPQRSTAAWVPTPAATPTPAAAAPHAAVGSTAFRRGEW